MVVGNDDIINPKTVITNLASCLLFTQRSARHVKLQDFWDDVGEYGDI